MSEEFEVQEVVKPVRRRGAAMIAQWVFSGLALFASGLAIGLWVSQYVASERRAEQQPLLGTQPITTGGQQFLGQGASLAQPSTEDSAPPDVFAQDAQAPQDDALLRYKFTPGEEVTYYLDADVTGSGFELMTDSPVDLAIESDMTLATESVDGYGNANMKYTFDAMYVDGDFMGSAFELEQDQAGTTMMMNGKAVIDTANGVGSTKGIPQLLFLQQPIGIKVAPNGQVLNVSGLGGAAGVLEPLPMASQLEFPGGDLMSGYQWESYISMPVPGFGSAAKARILNTFLGYETVEGVECAVIHQEFLSQQKGGTLDSPESAFGEAMQFSMPLFDLEGENIIYFDVDRGRLHYSRMDLHLTMKIAQMLEGAASLLQEGPLDLSKLLGGDLSGVAGGSGLEELLANSGLGDLVNLEGLEALSGLPGFEDVHSLDDLTKQPSMPGVQQDEAKSNSLLDLDLHIVGDMYVADESGE